VSETKRPPNGRLLGRRTGRLLGGRSVVGRRIRFGRLLLLLLLLKLLLLLLSRLGLFEETPGSDQLDDIGLKAVEDIGIPASNQEEPLFGDSVFDSNVRRGEDVFGGVDRVGEGLLLGCLILLLGLCLRDIASQQLLSEFLLTGPQGFLIGLKRDGHLSTVSLAAPVELPHTAGNGDAGADSREFEEPPAVECRCVSHVASPTDRTHINRVNRNRPAPDTAGETATRRLTEPSCMADDPTTVPTEPRAAVDALAEHLTATAERPVPPATNRWLGEAEAVARDAASEGLDTETRRKRVQQAADLLESADRTGDEIADRHIDAAKQCCRVVLGSDS